MNETSNDAIANARATLLEANADYDAALASIRAANAEYAAARDACTAAFAAYNAALTAADLDPTQPPAARRACPR